MEELSLADTPVPEVQTSLGSLVRAYITKAAGEKPSKPKGLAHPAEVYECPRGCDLCEDTNLFIKDPNAKRKEITLTPEEQKYVRRKFIYIKTEKRNRQTKSALQKTFKEWKCRLRRWKSQVEALQKFQGLPRLNQALGDVKYDMLMGSTAQATDKAQSPSRSNTRREMA